MLLTTYALLRPNEEKQGRASNGQATNSSGPAPNLNAESESGPVQGQARSKRGYETPNDCFRGYLKAVRSNDWDALRGCLSERQQQIAVGRYAYQLERLAFIGLSGDDLREAKAILKDHGIGRVDIMAALQMASMPSGGLDDDKVVAVFGRVGATVTGRQAFMAKVCRVLDASAPPDAAVGGDNDQLLTSLLKSVTIEVDGDTAIAIVTPPEGAEQRINMVRLSGGWLVGERGPAFQPIRNAASPPHPDDKEFSPTQQVAMASLEAIGSFTEITLDYWSSPPEVGLARYECFRDNTTDEQLEPLRELTFLREVDLGGLTRITDKGAAHLAGMKRLRKLNLNHTQVSDRGLEFVVNLEDLEELLISGTNVTDVLIDRLNQCPKLEALNVANTEVTQEALGRFRQSHPDCFIASGQRDR